MSSLYKKEESPNQPPYIDDNPHAPSPLRVVEFYAGAGGFHFALLKASIPSAIVASIDINTNTNLVYSHNFPKTPHWNRNICGLTAKELDDLRADVFVLSPPCQPFTRQGQRRDNLDTRTDSFFHLIGLLTEMKKLPSYMVMENVQGFESSHTRHHFTSTLTSIGFTFQEFLLSPVQFGVPNSRLRYYLLAKRKPYKFSLPDVHTQFGTPCKEASPLMDVVSKIAKSQTQELNSSMATAASKSGETLIDEALKNASISSPELTDHSQAEAKDDSTSPVTENTATKSSLQALSEIGANLEGLPLPPNAKVTDSPSEISQNTLALQPISSYLQELSDDELSKFLVPDKILLKCAKAIDIVRPSCSRSCCFTRAYGHYAVGTGSVIQHCLDKEELDMAFVGYKRALEDMKNGSQSDPLSFLRPLKLRYFTPREVANLMCFPPSFVFPASLTNTQCYKVMGNSLNVHVVSVLMTYLFYDVQ